MARINREEVERVAALARLRLSDREADQMAAELDAILGFAESLQELDTSGIEPTSQPIPLSTPRRDDTPAAVLDTELIAANAPQFSDSAFLVPKVIDSETEG